MKGWVSAELYIDAPEAKSYFRLLEADRAAIDAEFGGPLEWQELPGRKGARIVVYKHGVDPTDETQWPEQHAWLRSALERLGPVFRPRVRVLNAADWQEPPEAE